MAHIGETVSSLTANLDKTGRRPLTDEQKRTLARAITGKDFGAEMPAAPKAAFRAACANAGGRPMAPA